MAQVLFLYFFYKPICKTFLKSAVNWDHRKADMNWCHYFIKDLKFNTFYERSSFHLANSPFLKSDTFDDRLNNDSFNDAFCWCRIFLRYCLFRFYSVFAIAKLNVVKFYETEKRFCRFILCLSTFMKSLALAPKKVVIQ